MISAAMERSVRTFAEFDETYIGEWDAMLEEEMQLEDVCRAVGPNVPLACATDHDTA